MENEEKSGKKESLQDLLKKRQEVDQELESKHTREITIMITDIKGSTGFQETHGDFAGRLVLEKHDEMLSHFLKKYNGKVIKGTGDGSMVVFDHPEDGVNAAIGMQRKLRDFNQDKIEHDQIHIRIALNHGKVIEDVNDIFGHAVSKTARIESATEADQICVSESVYNKVRNTEDIICRSVPPVKAKGVKEPMKLYRVVWSMEEETVGGGVTRTARAGLAGKTRKRKIFTIDISKEDEKIKISGYEMVEGEHKTVHRYEEVKIDNKKIQEYNTEVISLLNRANQQGRVNKEILNKLKTTGQLLYDEIFSAEIKRKLNATQAEDMTLNIDDHMVSIPWELLYDGNSFFCLRFNMGRLVRTRQAISESTPRKLGLPLKMLILSDPKGNLKSAYKEGCGIRDKLDHMEKTINVNIKTSSIYSSYVLEKIRNFDMLHYAGHSDYDRENPDLSGWILQDKKLTASEIMKMSESNLMPSLVFSNSCHSGQTTEWKIPDNCENQIYGMANAFLLTGVQHYIGTFWEILDEPGSHFASAFYENLSQNKPIGEAVRKARLELIERYGEETIVWASYMLYGDPSFYYVPADMESMEASVKSEVEADSVREPLPAGGARSGDSMTFPASLTTAGIPKWIYGTIGALAAMLLIVFAFSQWNASKQTNLLEKSLEQSKANQSVVLKSQEAALSEQKAAIASEQKQDQVDNLVNELAKRYREGNIESGKNTPDDDWTSRPLIVTLFPIEMKNRDKNSAAAEALSNLLNNHLASNDRVKLVDRTLIDKLLEELKLSSSDLADPETALRIGKLVGARFIAKGSIFPIGEDMQLTLKLIETETTLMIKTIIKSATQSSLPAIAAEIAAELTESLKKQFPFKGKILSVEDENIIINLGRSHGISSNLQLKVFLEKEIKGMNKKIKAKIGIIRVNDVDDEVSTAVIISKAKKEINFVQGMKVAEIQGAVVRDQGADKRTR